MSAEEKAAYNKRKADSMRTRYRSHAEVRKNRTAEEKEAACKQAIAYYAANKVLINAMEKKQWDAMKAKKKAWRKLLGKNKRQEDKLAEEFDRSGICYARNMTMFFDDGTWFFPGFLIFSGSGLSVIVVECD